MSVLVRERSRLTEVTMAENEGESGGQGASNAVSEIKSGNCFVLFHWRQAMAT